MQGRDEEDAFRAGCLPPSPMRSDTTNETVQTHTQTLTPTPSSSRTPAPTESSYNSPSRSILLQPRIDNSPSRILTPTLTPTPNLPSTLTLTSIPTLTPHPLTPSRRPTQATSSRVISSAAPAPRPAWGLEVASRHLRPRRWTRPPRHAHSRSAPQRPPTCRPPLPLTLTPGPDPRPDARPRPCPPPRPRPRPRSDFHLTPTLTPTLTPGHAGGHYPWP